MDQGLGRAAVAAGVGVQQLMNRLTDHLWLYHEVERNISSNLTGCQYSKEKVDVLRWFQGLSTEQRQEVLVIKDRDWVNLLVQMQKKLEDSGPTNFFLMLDMGDAGPRSVLRSIQPELLCRRPVGLLARLTPQNSAGKELTDSLLFFSSRFPELTATSSSLPATKKSKGKGSTSTKMEGFLAKKSKSEKLGFATMNQINKTAGKARENEVDVMVVAKGFLDDPQKLVQTLDCLTFGQFLQNPCGQQATGSFDETRWLHSMGYCALPFYVANRLELAIWSAWLRSTACNLARTYRTSNLALSKARPIARTSKVFSQQQLMEASAANALEKHRTMQAWWQKLDLGSRSQILQAAVARLAQQLAVESVVDAREGRDLREAGIDTTGLQELGSRCQAVLLRSTKQDLAGSVAGLQKVPWLVGLLAIQELSESGRLQSNRQSPKPGSRGEQRGSVASQKVDSQSDDGVGREGNLGTRGGRRDRRQLEREMEWLVMTYGNREKAKNDNYKCDGLFCTSLQNACTLRGRLVCRLRHVVQQLMQEHIAQELLGNVETVDPPPVNSRGSKSGSKSTKKKKSSGTRGISGAPENKAANKEERSNQSKSEVNKRSELAPRVAPPLAETNGVLRANLAARDDQVVTDPELRMLPSLFGGERAAVATPPSIRAVENPNETDEEERCSSSGEAWEEVGAAKRRKERRRRTEDKDVKREPRKRALQPLEAPWNSQDGHPIQAKGVEADGEHRKRRRRRKGKERKKEETGPAGGVSEAPRGLGFQVEESSRQKGAESSSVRTSGGEKSLVVEQHKGWNLAAPVFEPRSLPKPTSMLESNRYFGRGSNQSGSALNQAGLGFKPPGFSPYQIRSISDQSGVNPEQGNTSSRNQAGYGSNQIGSSSNKVGSQVVSSNGDVVIETGRENLRTPQGACKRSLSVGNAPEDKAENQEQESSTGERQGTNASAQPPPPVVPITPLKQTIQSHRIPPVCSSSLTAGSDSQQVPLPQFRTGPSQTKPFTQQRPEESRHRWHEWPQYQGGLAMASNPARAPAEQLMRAQTGPSAPNQPRHVTGFDIAEAVPAVPHLGMEGPPEPAKPGLLNRPGVPNHPNNSQSVPFNATNQVSVHPNPARLEPTPPNQAPHFQAPPNLFSAPETMVPAPSNPFYPPGHQPGDFPSAFLRPVAMHRSRSSHQLPDNGFPFEPPGPFSEQEHSNWAGHPFPGGLNQGVLKPPEAWPFQSGVQSVSPESHWPPNLPRITVPTGDYFTDEDWLMGGAEDAEGSTRNGNGYDVESEAEVSGRYVMSEGEVDGPLGEASFKAEAAQDDSRIDYSRIFDGGVLYWTADNYSTLGLSRPNSLSSNDSMWMRREADISCIVDDIAGAPAESPTSLAYVAADVSTSPAPSERAASPLPGGEQQAERSAGGDLPKAVRRMPRVRAVRLQGSRPSPVLVRANLNHTPPRSVYQGLSPDLRYARGLSPDTFLRHLPTYQALTRQGSVGAANDTWAGNDVRWKRPSSPVLRYNPSPAHVSPPVPPLASAPRARPANVRSGSSSPRHWAPALDGREGEKAPGIDAEGSFRGAGAEYGPGAGAFTLGEKLAAVAGNGGFGRNPSVKKGLPPLAPITHSPDQDHPDVLIPIHHWVAIPPFCRSPETVRSQSESVPDSVERSVNPAAVGEVTQLQPVVLFSPLTPLSPPGSQHVPPEWALFHDLLHKEVERFCADNREEMARKRPFQLAAITKVSKALQVLWPRSRITVFGSFITGLALPTSDIDLLVCLPPVRNLEPIKEAGILEGRNGIKETMLQHAARYLADQDWVKTDSMKTIENTAVPIIQLVAQMPLQPLQASSPPSEKAPEESVPISGALHSPRGENVPPLSGQTPGRTLVHGMSAPGGVAGEEKVVPEGPGDSTGDLLLHPVRSLSAPGRESSVGNGLLSPRGGIQTPLQRVPFAENAGGAGAQHPAEQTWGCQSAVSSVNDTLSSVDKARSSMSGRSAVLTCEKDASEGDRSAQGARVSVAAALRGPLADEPGGPASDGDSDACQGSRVIDSEGVTAPSEESETGIRENGGAHVPLRNAIQGELMHARSEVGGLRGDVVGVCSLGADTAAGSVGASSADPGLSASVRDTSSGVGLDLPGAGSQIGREGARADVSADVGTSERRALKDGDLEGGQSSVSRGLEQRERKLAQVGSLEDGGKPQPDVTKPGGGRLLPLIRMRADVDQLERGHVEGAHSPGDQERRLVKLDISFEGVQHTGSRTTDLVRELVAQFPPLPPLVLVLKQFLTDRSLDHPYTGGLSSYCLVLLVTRFLQHEQHVSGVRAQQAGQNLGLLLMDFLHFFGCVFDPRRMGVSIRAGGMYIDRDKGHSIDPLYIEDPLIPLNNVGRNCFRILQCTKAFGEGHVLLSKQLHLLDANSTQTNLFSKILTKCGQ